MMAAKGRNKSEEKVELIPPTEPTPEQKEQIERIVKEPVKTSTELKTMAEFITILQNLNTRLTKMMDRLEKENIPPAELLKFYQQEFIQRLNMVQYELQRERGAIKFDAIIGQDGRITIPEATRKRNGIPAGAVATFQIVDYNKIPPEQTNVELDNRRKTKHSAHFK
jgi:hypothetical protein